MNKLLISPESCIAVIRANTEGYMSDEAFREFVRDTLKIVESPNPSITKGDIWARHVLYTQEELDEIKRK